MTTITIIAIALAIICFIALLVAVVFLESMGRRMEYLKAQVEHLEDENDFLLLNTQFSQELKTIETQPYNGMFNI